LPVSSFIVVYVLKVLVSIYFSQNANPRLILDTN
jgi:hypothetical protein